MKWLPGPGVDLTVMRPPWSWTIPRQVGRLGRLVRLQSLLAKFWRATLLLEMIQRLFGKHRAKRILRLNLV